VFTQINPLNFTMPFGGANSLAQVINIATEQQLRIRYGASVATAKVALVIHFPGGNGCCFAPLA